MQLIETAQLTFKQKEMLYKLWNQEYPEQVSYKRIGDFYFYLSNLTRLKHYLLMNDSGGIEGWAFTFIRENEKWFAILLDEKIQGLGKGTLLLNELKKKERTLNGWAVDHGSYKKQNGDPYKSPLKFYEKNGFTICPECKLETEKLSAVKIVWQQE